MERGEPGKGEPGGVGRVCLGQIIEWGRRADAFVVRDVQEALIIC